MINLFTWHLDPFRIFPSTALMVGPLPAIRAVQGVVSGLWKIPIGHMSPQTVATEAIPTYI